MSNIIDLSGNNSGLPAASNGQRGAATDVEQSRAVQEVQAALIIAKRFPRDEVEAINRIRNECQRPGLAEVATYLYARGGTEITGPSIRLAEVLKRHWGNIQSGFRILDQNALTATVQAYAWDQETNVKEEKTFVQRLVRNTKKGSYPLTDERDIYELVANNAMRRVRACILSIIPGDIAEMAVEECEKTKATNVNITPDRLNKMVEAFSGYGVTREAIEKRIQRTIDAITPAQFISLGKIAASIRDGIGKPSDFFDVEDKKQEAQKTSLDDFKAKKSAEKEKEQEQAPTENHEQPHNIGD